MNKEEFIKKIKKDLNGIPKYTGSKQVDALAEQMWEEYKKEEKNANTSKKRRKK